VLAIFEASRRVLRARNKAHRRAHPSGKDELQMEFMTWTPGLSVGVAVLDDDHKRLIGIINQLHFGIVAGHDREVLEAVLDELVDYTIIHFSREEEMLLKAGYLATPAHRMEHERFIRQISNLQKRVKSASVAMLDLELMDFLRDWLFSHILVSDKKYESHLNNFGLF
jgi:hemerythrin-like metal-binding protein